MKYVKYVYNIAKYETNNWMQFQSVKRCYNLYKDNNT